MLFVYVLNLRFHLGFRAIIVISIRDSTKNKQIKGHCDFEVYTSPMCSSGLSFLRSYVNSFNLASRLSYG